MQAIDHNGDMADIMLDEKRRIPRAHLDNVCKIHQGKQTCRYIGLGVKGFVCVKHSPIHTTLDEQVEKNQISSCGDNCGGMYQPKPEKENNIKD